jgi:hypothetical protein
MRLEYSAPRTERVCLQLEGVIAESCIPAIKNGKVYYEEYTTEYWETPDGQDLTII